MDPSHSLRHWLLFGVASAAIVLHTGCGDVYIEGAGGGGAGGAGMAAGAGGAGDGDGGMCALTSTGTGGELIQVTECFDAPEKGCPNQYQASMYIVPAGCAYLVSIDCGPMIEGSTCCYLVKEQPHMCMP